MINLQAMLKSFKNFWFFFIILLSKIFCPNITDFSLLNSCLMLEEARNVPAPSIMTKIQKTIIFWDGKYFIQHLFRQIYYVKALLTVPEFIVIKSVILLCYVHTTV